MVSKKAPSSQASPVIAVYLRRIVAFNRKIPRKCPNVNGVP